MVIYNNLFDNLVRIQNAISSRNKYVKIKRNNFIIKVLNILYDNGFINGFFVSPSNFYDIIVSLKYIKDKPVFKKFKFFSKSSKLQYISKNLIRKNFLKKGFFMISTSAYGIILLNSETFNDINIKNNFKTGGELLFQIIID